MTNGDYQTMQARDDLAREQGQHRLELAERDTAIERLTLERNNARAAIALVFDMIEHGDLEVVHWSSLHEQTACPQDDTCECRPRRLLLDLQIAGAIDADAARALLAKLPPKGPHDRADCPCGHPLGTQRGVRRLQLCG